MKLEKGKSYLTKGGTRVDIVADDLNGEYPFAGIVRFKAMGDRLVAYLPDGRADAGEGCPFDLVGEYVDRPEFDRSLLPAWANKAIAMDSDGGWFCFSGRPKFVAGGVWGRLGLWVCEIPLYCAPKWEGAAEDSLLVWEDEE